MNARIIATLALAATARADVRTAHAWMQGAQSAGFAFANVDLDDETQTVSVMVEFQNLLGACTGGRLVDGSGQTLCALAAPAASAGFAFGTATIDSAAVAALLQGEGRLELASAAQPGAEISSAFGFQPLSIAYPLSTQQVAGAPQSSAWGTGYAFVPLLGGAGFSGQLRDLSGAVTAVEVRRGAWYGGEGELMFQLTALGNPSPNFVTCSGAMPALTAEERRDLEDGLCYLLVRTSTFPAGELRGQITAPWIGDRYCAPRPNSVATIGAQLQVLGSPLASDASVQLHGEALPPNRSVLPIVGLGTGHVYAPTTLGGLLCVGGAGVARLGAFSGISNAGGEFDAQVELNSVTLGGLAPALAPDLRLNFQLWYRDPTGPTTTNLSSAVSIRFR